MITDILANTFHDIEYLCPKTQWMPVYLQADGKDIKR